MKINFLSSAEEASFSELLHGESELTELIGSFLLKLGIETDYDTVIISFESDHIVRIRVEESPFLIIFNEDEQRIELEQDDGYSTDEIFELDGVESIVDIIADRVFTSEDGDEDWRSEMIHYGI